MRGDLDDTVGFLGFLLTVERPAADEDLDVRAALLLLIPQLPPRLDGRIRAGAGRTGGHPANLISSENGASYTFGAS